MERELTLDWSDLINISGLNYNDQNKAGIYIWGFTIDNVFIPYYVGVAENILFRIHEHINLIIGGRYTIFHKDSLLNFKDFKNQEIQEGRTKGRVYLPDWPYGYKNFINNRKELQPHIDFMVDTFTFLFALVNMEIFTKSDLREIEKNCINLIGKENLINTRGGVSSTFSIIHIGNPVITNIIKATNR